MKKVLIPISILLFLFGCSTSEIQTVVQATLNKNPQSALKSIAQKKASVYIANPKQLSSDIKNIDTFIQKALQVLLGNIIKEWGKDDAKTPTKQEVVKYMQNYKSRALIDFDRGIVTVETLDQNNPLQSLQKAIVTTLLLPNDPQSADLFSSKEIQLGGTPYLLGEVVDDQGKNIRYMWRANRYAEILLQNTQTKTIAKDNTKVHFVQIPMVKDHADIRVQKYMPFVKQYAKRFGLSENLVYAIIRTESNFNQFAISSSGALGLMQVVPSTAGKDAYKHLTGKNWTPTQSYLFDPKNNIQLGSAYIQILQTRYLVQITNPLSREYCVISAYNTGSGNVLRTFDQDRSLAAKRINAQTPAQIYNTLITNLPYEETRRYLQKVITFKKDFVAL